MRNSRGYRKNNLGLDIALVGALAEELHRVYEGGLAKGYGSVERITCGLIRHWQHDPIHDGPTSAQIRTYANCVPKYPEWNLLSLLQFPMVMIAINTVFSYINKCLGNAYLQRKRRG